MLYHPQGQWEGLTNRGRTTRAGLLPYAFDGADFQQQWSRKGIANWHPGRHCGWRCILPVIQPSGGLLLPGEELGLWSNDELRFEGRERLDAPTSGSSTSAAEPGADSFRQVKLAVAAIREVVDLREVVDYCLCAIRAISWHEMRSDHNVSRGEGSRRV